MFKDKNGKKLTLSQTLEKVINRFYNYLLDLELFILRLVSLFPIYSLRYIFYLAAGVKIGRGSHLHMGTQWFYPPGVEIGEDTIIGQNAFLDGRAKLKIGSHVDIASDVMIYNSEHDIDSEGFTAVTGSVEIGDYVFIGPRSIILQGVKIGKGAVIAAGAVVTRDIAEFTVVGGVPAKFIRQRNNKEPNYRLGRARLFQ